MDEPFNGLEARIGYVFKNKELLQQMLTHPSLLKKKRGAPDFERLEFLGDRVLGLVVANWLYRSYRQDAEGMLSKRHSHFVGRKALQHIAEQIELGKSLLFAQDVRQKHHTILSDACEALIGAIFLDGGVRAAQKFILSAWKGLLNDKTISLVDSKSALQEWSQSRQKGLPLYEVVETSGPGHDPRFKVSVRVEGLQLFYGQGVSKREAEKQAAEKVLVFLKTSE
jgi:ribonuclease III